MTGLAVFVPALAGFAALALAMHRHQRQIWHRTLGRGAGGWLRLAGAGGLAASFAASVTAAGWAVGPVLWLGWLTAAALTVALALTWWPRRT